VDYKQLKLITDDTLKALKAYEVITPELFTDTFLIKAKEKNIIVDIDDLENIQIENILSKMVRIQEATKEGAQELKENIDLAATAIDNQDKNALLEVKKQMDALQQRISQLEEQVYVDELTKVYNRKWLFEKMLKEDHFRQNGAIGFVDIDDFKHINDNYGHIAGDKVLFLIASMIKKIPDSQVMRYGGDEFIVFLVDQDKSVIERYFEKINNDLSSKSFKLQDRTFKVSLSLGAENFTEGASFHDVAAIVDQKMYADKKRRKAAKATASAV